MTTANPSASDTSPRLAARNRELLDLRDAALHLAYRISSSAGDAEDILQESYLHAVRAQTPILAGHELRNWFLQIVANAARDHLRAESGRRTRERNAAVNHASMTAPAPSVSLEQAELKAQVETELARLDEKMRVPISLHYEHGLSFEEVSGVLGIPAATLRVQAFRGLDELRARLNASGKKTLTAELLIAALGIGFCCKATPALAASVEAIVTSGAHSPSITSAASSMKVYGPEVSSGLPFGLKVAGIAALLALGGFAVFFAKSRLNDSVEQAAAVRAAQVATVEDLQNTVNRSVILDKPVAVELPSGLIETVPAPVSIGTRVVQTGDYFPPPEVEAPWNNAVELLPSVNPARDGVYGTWEFIGQDLCVQPCIDSRLAIQYYPPEEFDYRVDFTRVSGNAEVDLVFPVKHKCALLSVGAWNALYFSGNPKDNPDLVPNLNLRSNVRHTAIVEVRKTTLTAWLDGKLMKSIEIDKSMYACNAQWRVPDQDTLGVAVWDSGVHFHRLAVREVTGKGRFKEPDPDAVRIAGEEHWKDAVDLLPAVDPKNAVSGKWSIEQGALKSEKNKYARIELGYEPPEEYDFRIDVRRIDGERDIVQICSAKGRQFAWKFAAANVCVIDSIDGKIHAGNPSAMVLPQLGVDTLKHVSVVCVRKDIVKAFLDGKLITQWHTNYSDMGIDIWKLAHARMLGLGANDSQVVFEKILLKEITGQGLKSAAPPKEKDGF